MKLDLYFHTIKYMKPSQIAWRILKKCRIPCTTGRTVISREELLLEYGSLSEAVRPVKDLPELDFDPFFLSRFSTGEWREGKLTLLHEKADLDLTKTEEIWQVKDKSALWNFNLHYFEYLFPFEAEEDLIWPMEVIKSYIHSNPQEKGGPAWSPYTIDLRLTNWISWYSRNHKKLPESFRETMLRSMHRQYAYLSNHLEKEILGNHYFEDLKTLILCALFFQDDEELKVLLPAFYKECREEILSDGMHFELSPMYHRLILEGIIRVAKALEERGRDILAYKRLLASMADAMYSMEAGTKRVPLFNDSGDNISKSKEALLMVLRQWKIEPKYQSILAESGFYLYQEGPWKLIIDAGQPGPAYIPGHAHCDALSFELFYEGKPLLVNSGTYAYQCQERGYYRSTEAHNTFSINGREQSACWGAFRMAKRSIVRVHKAEKHELVAEIRDQKGQRAIRSFKINLEQEKLVVTDRTLKEGDELTAYLHMTDEAKMLGLCCRVTEGEVLEEKRTPYAEEYGKAARARTLSYRGRGKVSLEIYK